MKKIGDKIDLKDLKVNDLFYMNYGYEIILFRVHKIIGPHVLAHARSWLKSSSIKIHGDRDMFYGGKVSKLRAFFML